MKGFVAVVALVAVLMMSLPVQAEQEAQIVHFVVVSPAVEGVDYSKELPGLEKFFVRTAGGFTDMGNTRGGELKSDGVNHEAHLTYMVAAKKDIAAQIFEYVRLHFRKDPFILTWPAEMYSPSPQ